MAKKMKKIEWEVKSLPVLYKNSEGDVVQDERYKMMAKPTDEGDSPLGIVRASYTPFTNEEFMELTDKIAEQLEEFGYKFDEYKEKRKGAHVVANFALTTDGMGFLKELGFKDGTFVDKIFIRTSHDGSSAIKAGSVVKVVACGNMFGSIHDDVRIVHLSGIGENSVDIFDAVADLIESRNAIYDTFADMKKKKIDDKVMDFALLKMVNADNVEGELSERKQELIATLKTCLALEVESWGKNVWALFNAATRFSTHHLSVKGDRDEDAVAGSPANFNKKTLAICAELLKG